MLFNLSDFLKVLSFVFVGLTLLMLDSYGHVYRALLPSIDKKVTRRQILLTSVKLFTFSPFMILIQAWPRLVAIFKHFFRKRDTTWYKTERSREVTTAI